MGLNMLLESAKVMDMECAVKLIRMELAMVQACSQEIPKGWLNWHAPALLTIMARLAHIG